MARQCAVGQADFARFLLRTTELELLDRERRATEGRSTPEVRIQHKQLHAVRDLVRMECDFNQSRATIEHAIED